MSVSSRFYYDDWDEPFLAVYHGGNYDDLLHIAEHWEVVPVRLKTKFPRDKGWPERHYTVEEIAARLASGNQLGIKLTGNLLDVDFDGPEAGRLYAELFAGVEEPATPSWQSTRGKHKLFECPPELAALGKSKFYFGPKGQLEIRTGASGTLQTVLPHPENDKTWIGPPLSVDFPPALLPQVVVDRLVEAANAKPQDDSKVKEQVNKVVEWAEANGFQPGNVETKDAFTVVNVTVCPFKGQDDGNAGIIINHETGHVGFNCFHAKCAGKTLADLEAIASVPFTGRRAIIIEPPEHRMVDQASSSLRDVEDLYQLGTALVRIVFSSFAEEGINRPPDVPTIQPVSTAALQEILSRSAEWYTRGKDAMKRDYVPSDVVKLLDARNSYPVPPLVAIVSSPVLRPDGTILSDAGYDAATGLYLATDIVLPELSIDEAKAAIDYLFIDFPFATEADKAALIAGLLTPLARQAFTGSTPLFLIEANVPGTGKSLAADVIGSIVIGREMSRMTAPSGDEEWRKRITAIVIDGEQLILIDNVATTLASPSLDAMLTGTTWSDRVLALSKTVTAPIVHTTFATANNVVVGGDLVRRTLPIRLQSPLENPETRSDFREPDLLIYVQRNRAKLLAAALTILRHYFAAGKPNMSLPSWGSYEGWSNVVRAAVVFAGYPDPIESRAEFAEQADESGELLRLLIAGWDELDPNGEGLRATDAYKRRNESEALTEAIESLPQARDVSKQLGVTLKRFRGRPIGGRAFEFVKDRKGTNVYKVIHL